ncbi:glycosyltransferase [Sphingomonas sp. AP4-R1]|uniref:glycosyltransferase n=1 Tax=Sphingomonas sp. AP4-R1 TaxID=2735134 RepID=UPI001493BE7E|nr:glycosyltransferase [Sphingomonas sp. AP4-R1]QJU56509.1 glycosyltransferase [Sphingomonas sp. AP4-R1]
MRILTFLHSYEPGGVERIALRLVREWRARGIDAPLFVGRADGTMRDDVGAGLAPIIPPPPRNGLDPARWEAIWMILTLPRVVREQQPDVLFCAGNTYAVIAIALKLLLGPACPPIVAKISNDLRRRDKPWWRRMLYRFYLRVQGRLFDRVIGMEASAVDEICEMLAVHRDRITVIPDPALSHAMIATLRDAPARPMEGGRRFVAVGRLARQKNLPLMLRAFARGAAPEDRLALIGEGPERPRLEALAAELGIAGRVSFPGYHPEPATILCGHDVLLLSSDYEGVPAVVIEALAARLPIVATDCSASMGALLLGGRLGDLVPVRDEALFAGAIARAVPSRQDAALTLRQAERFTIERASDLYLAVMRGSLRRVAKERMPLPVS